MAKQLSDAQFFVRMYLDEAAAADYTDQEVLVAINFGYHDVVGSVIEVKEDYYDTITKFTYAMVANQQEYAIDTTLVKPTRVEINFSPTVANSNPIKATPIKMNEDLINLNNTSTVQLYGQVGYYLHGKQSTQTIGFIPIPTVSDVAPTKSISVWGIALPSDLVNSADMIDIPYADRFTYLIGLRAAAILLSKGQQEEANATKYLSRYEMEVEKMKNFLASRQEDGVEMVQDSEPENTDFSWPV